MLKRITILQGHPDPRGQHFGHALADAYATGARVAGHEIKSIEVAKLDFPLLRSSEEFYQGPTPEGILPAQAAIRWADHLILGFAGISPIRTILIGWLGGDAGEPEGAFPRATE